MPPVKLDHCVIHVADWERSNKFYSEVMGAELVPRPVGWAYRFGDKQLNVHGPGVKPAEVARLPGAAGQQRFVLRMAGPDRRRDRASQTAWHPGRARTAAMFRRQGARDFGFYFRDPDGSLMEFMSYTQPLISAEPR